MAESNKYRFKDLNVEDCFKDFYTVPDYQREYVWRAEYEVAQLLIDLYDEFSGDKTKEYFIGCHVHGARQIDESVQRHLGSADLQLAIVAHADVGQLRHLFPGKSQLCTPLPQACADLDQYLFFHNECTSIKHWFYCRKEKKTGEYDKR